MSIDDDSTLYKCYHILQVLANVAATSIPQVAGQVGQMVAMQSPDGTQQMVSIPQASTSAGIPQPQQVQVPEGTDPQDVLGQAANPYQTVTIVPSEVNQGGEVGKM